MRCVTVQHELSAPTGEFPQALLDEHLAGCPSCARCAEQNARIDRLWEATRPSELSDAAWDRIWAKAAAGLDQTQVTVAPPALAPISASAGGDGGVGRHFWRRSAVAVFVLAQAAAILIGFGLTWYQAPAQVASNPDSALASASVDSTPAVTVTAVTESESAEMIPDFDIPADQTVLISLDRKVAQDLTADENSNTLSPFSLPMFNAVESLASLQ